MELFREILTEIEAIPAVDVHCRVRMTEPAASDLAEIALSRDIRDELTAAGADRGVFESEGAKKGLAEAWMAFARIKNTASYWCLTQILADLHGADAPHECEMGDLWAKVEEAASGPGWAESVLTKANVTKCFAACDWRKHVPKASERFAPILRVDTLVNEAHMSRTLDGLGEATGQSVYEVADLKKAITALFRKANESGAVAAAASFEPQTDFEPGDRDSADRILSLVLLGQKTNREDRKAIRSYVLDLVLQNCAEHGMPMQLVLGTKWVRSSEVTIVAHEPTAVSMYMDVFARHPQVAFDILAAHEALSHELATVSRSTPNVYLSGYWRQLAFPTRIRRIIRERIEMLPMTRCCGLASGATCIEWVYGRAKLMRRELAMALAELVQEGYLAEGTAIDVARCYLQENPARLYGMS